MYALSTTFPFGNDTSGLQMTAALNRVSVYVALAVSKSEPCRASGRHYRFILRLQPIVYHDPGAITIH